jgi:hypothetical protein
MSDKPLELLDLVTPDHKAMDIAHKWHTWDRDRQVWKNEKVEIRKYIFATDTSTTTNQSLPWKNSTHIPKLCQIRDNLNANYNASLFPKSKWVIWEGKDKLDEDNNKKQAIKDYMAWVISQKRFRDEISKLILDYIDYGNAIATTEWVDESTQGEDGVIKPGYVGPVVKRINPLDIVANPVASSFNNSPKIIRSLMTKGEAKRILEQLTSTPEQKEIAKEVWKYMMEFRSSAYSAAGDFKELDEFFYVDGFESYKEYLGSDYVELLTFMGDYYEHETDTFYKNHMIVVMDRCKVIVDKQHPVRSGQVPIRHSGWRVRQDNIWAMGPLDNLVGMQYRIDHVENMKADIFDLTTYPPLKVKGIVEDFEWGPFERIFVDGDGDVEIMSPDVNVLQANIEIQAYEDRMEEMAGSPKEAAGFRTPGEKTAYEVQRLENAASRIFQAKIRQFEEQIIESVLNDMLSLARDNLTSETIRVIDDEFKSSSFRKITKKDLSAQGTLKPVAARHFAERAELVQNLNNFFSSPVGQDPSVLNHFSTIKIAKMFEEILDLQDYEVVQENVRLSEQADSQRVANVHEEEVLTEAGTPAGIAEDDFDE